MSRCYVYVFTISLKHLGFVDPEEIRYGYPSPGETEVMSDSQRLKVKTLGRSFGTAGWNHGDAVALQRCIKTPAT